MVTAPQLDVRDGIAAAFRDHGVDAGPEPGRQVRVQTTAAAVSQLAENRGRGVWWADEAHHIRSAGGDRLARSFPLRAGSTATPGRLDGKPLRPPFDCMVSTPSVRSLIDRGFLEGRWLVRHPGRPLYAPRKTAARRDYGRGKLLAKARLLGDPGVHWSRHLRNQRCAAYTCSLEHSRWTAERLRKHGAVVELVDGDTPASVRAELYAGLESRDIDVLCNVAVLTEGVDIPHLEAGILLRPTLSLVLHLQIVGRFLRRFPGKLGVTFHDHADNFRLHGFPDDEREWSLDGEPPQVVRLGDLRRSSGPRSVDHDVPLEEGELVRWRWAA